MRTTTLLLATALLTACGSGEQAAPAAGPTLADFAGTWQNSAMVEGTPDPVPSTLHGSVTATGWTMDLEGRPGIPLTVSMNGDSLIAQSAEYESVLRAGVMVSIRTASVLTNDMLNGKLVATYKTPDGVQIVNGTMQATRAN